MILISAYMKIKIDVFQKTYKTAEGREFVAYSTKNRDGVYHQVRFTMDCVNQHLLPKNRRPFTIVTDNTKVSKGVKKYGELVTPIYYVRAIESIEDYIEVGVDTSEFEPLPF